MVFWRKKATVKNLPTGNIKGDYELWDPSKSIEVEGAKGVRIRKGKSKRYKKRFKKRRQARKSAEKLFPYATGALGALLGGPAGAVSGATLGGLFVGSEKVQKASVSYLKDPGKTGREIGKIIDEPSKAGSVLDPFKTAILGGAAALGLGGAIVGGKKAWDWWKRRKGRKKSQPPPLSPSPVTPSQSGVLVTEISPIPSATTPQSAAVTEEKDAAPSTSVGQIPKINNVVQIANYIN